MVQKTRYSVSIHHCSFTIKCNYQINKLHKRKNVVFLRYVLKYSLWLFELQISDKSNSITVANKVIENNLVCSERTNQSNGLLKTKLNYIILSNTCNSLV